MKEVLSSSYEGTFSKNVNVLNNCKRIARVAFFFRCFVFLSVISIFYVKFLVTSEPFSEENTVPDFVFISNGRRVLSVSSTATPNAEIKASTSSGRVSSPNCTSPAIFEFPSDGFTRLQRQHGWIVLHVIVAFYCFWLLAAICDDYFVPAIEQICATVQLQKDVVGATFMAAATSSPELFMNCVGTFVTKGDIGVGTIVGSAVFNILAVPACCGFFAGHYVRLDWWPVTRDCLMYCVAVLALIATLFDGKIMWYEALSLAAAYFLYMAVMYNNDKMARTARRLISKYRRKSRFGRRAFSEVTEFTPLILSSVNKNNNNNNYSKVVGAVKDHHSTFDVVIEEAGSLRNDTNSLNSLSSDESDYADSPWQLEGRNLYEYLLRWPITLLLWLTIPDSRKHPRCKYLAFLLSVAWIGGISYIVAYVVTIMGDTLNIPDSVMGLTVLAAGMSVPEAVSSVIVTRQGQGAMGISNSIGSNTFDILLCLGLPWFIKAYFMPANPTELWISLNSTGLTYSAIFLLTTLFGLFIAFVVNRFVLDWKIGIACTVMYFSFMVIASMIELNVFFPVNLPICQH